MNIVAKTENKDLATVYVAEMGEGKLVEFVESVQPPHPIEKKWVLIISTLFGCPVKCRICDSGGMYRGMLSRDQMLSQIDYMIQNRFHGNIVPVEKFKIQFSRMGEPALNDNVLQLLQDLPELYRAPGLLPSISTIAPKGSKRFFERLLAIKDQHFGENFQLQFSIHTTDEKERDWVIPTRKWSFLDIANYGNRFFRPGERKITLNFALAKDAEIDTDVLLNYFDPEKYLVKITPINPTHTSKRFGMKSLYVSGKERNKIITDVEKAGYDVILSIGELEENQIGSNCGQHVINHLREKKELENSYTYKVKECDCSLSEIVE